MSPEDESVSHLMSTPIVVLDRNTNVGEMLQLSERLSIHHFPLINEGGLFGIVCTWDVEGARPEQVLAEFVRRTPITVRPGASAREAARYMMRERVGSVIVVDEDGVWGILTRDDLAETVPVLTQHLHCVHCGSRQHLSPGPGHTMICPSCAERELRADLNPQLGLGQRRAHECG